jgi:hypothetical protein
MPDHPKQRDDIQPSIGEGSSASMEGPRHARTCFGEAGRCLVGLAIPPVLKALAPSLWRLVTRGRWRTGGREHGTSMRRTRSAWVGHP